jgi:hypothetical protein
MGDSLRSLLKELAEIRKKEKLLSSERHIIETTLANREQELKKVNIEKIESYLRTRQGYAYYADTTEGIIRCGITYTRPDFTTFNVIIYDRDGRVSALIHKKSYANLGEQNPVKSFKDWLKSVFGGKLVPVNKRKSLKTIKKGL